MLSWTSDNLAAFSIFSSDTSSYANEILLEIVSENKKLSWGTYPIESLTCLNGNFMMSTLSKKSSPLFKLYVLNKISTNVDLPAPVLPIIPTNSPLLMCKLISCKTSILLSG